MNNIPIVISSDNNIFFTVGVVLTSLLDNANAETFYEINCLCADNVTNKNKKLLEKSLKKYNNYSLTFYDMKGKFKDIPTTEGYHVNYVSAYKMLIPAMFPQYDKVLYLDTDILVRDDLTDFYNYEINDNYIAGVPVLGYIIDKKIEIKKLLQLESLDSYINAGVMLMNLKQIRNDEIDKKWISLLGSYKGSVDQHILNKVCYQKTAFVPLKFNVCFSEIKFFNSDIMQKYYSFEESMDAFNNPIIFHWTGDKKPWRYKRLYLAQEWLDCYKKTYFSISKLYFEIFLYFVVKSYENFIKTMYAIIKNVGLV